ncbi:TPA: carbohydrate deacetylase, partial [Streptococcus equi subsp. zooepidemicus]|nr:carbohydrate deacetylase [Streptococcus equi subsp. zooepidemicus]
MKKVIINADDFGYSPAVNAGIIKAFQDGILTSTTLMANMPGCDEAIMLAKENPDLGVGVHMVLTCGESMTKGKTISQQGKFYSLKNYHENRFKIDDEEIYQEWCCQIDYLLDEGLKPTHIDSHHHLHTFPENLLISQRIAQRYGLPLRNAYGLEINIDLPNQIGATGFFDLTNYPHIRDLSKSIESDKIACLTEVEKLLDQIEDNTITELMVHPAYVDEILYFNSSFNIARVKEVSLLCDQDVAQLFKDFNIQLYHYGNI